MAHQPTNQSIRALLALSADETDDSDSDLDTDHDHEEEDDADDINANPSRYSDMSASDEEEEEVSLHCPLNSSDLCASAERRPLAHQRCWHGSGQRQGKGPRP